MQARSSWGHGRAWRERGAEASLATRDRLPTLLAHHLLAVGLAQHHSGYLGCWSWGLFHIFLIGSLSLAEHSRRTSACYQAAERRGGKELVGLAVGEWAQGRPWVWSFKLREIFPRHSGFWRQFGVGNDCAFPCLLRRGNGDLSHAYLCGQGGSCLHFSAEGSGSQAGRTGMGRPSEHQVESQAKALTGFAKDLMCGTIPGLFSCSLSTGGHGRKCSGLTHNTHCLLEFLEALAHVLSH